MRRPVTADRRFDAIRNSRRRWSASASPDGTAHRIRHWYGTKVVDDDTDLRTAQTLLRHANLNTTAIYVQVSDPKRVEAIDRLNPYGGSLGRAPSARPVTSCVGGGGPTATARTHRLGDDTYPMALREVSQPETDNHCPHCEGLTERFKMVLTPWYESAEAARKKSMDVSGWNRRCTNGECPGRKGLPVDD